MSSRPSSSTAGVRPAKRPRVDGANAASSSSRASASSSASGPGAAGGRMVEIVEADGGGAARELVSIMETLDNLHDVTLRARNAGGQIESIHLHRVVLAAASPYAKAMFKDAWKGGKHKKPAAEGEGAEEEGGEGGADGKEADGGLEGGTVVNLEKNDVIHIESLRAVVAYIYRGVVRVEWGADLLSLARVADYLGLEGLTAGCVEVAAGGLQVDNAVEMLNLVGSTSSSGGGELWKEEMREASMGYVLQHFAELSQTEGFIQQMGVGVLCDVLGRDELRVKKEEEVFEFVERWMGAAGMGRGAAEAEQVLPLVRFPQMDSEYMATRVSPCKTAGIAGSALVKRLAMEAILYGNTLRPGQTMTWEQAVAAGYGEESPRTRRRVRYTSAVDATRMECGQVVVAESPVRSLAEVGGRVVSGHWGGSMRVWDPEAWTLVKTVEDAHGTGRILAMTTWQGMLVTGGDDSKIKVWEAGTWTCRHVLEDHTNCVWDVEVLDESTLLSCSEDKTIRVWDTTTWTCRRVVDSGHTHLAHCLALHAGMVYCGGLDTDGSGTVRVFEPSTWECVDVLRGHTSYVRLLMWQDKLVTADWDSTVKVWSTGATPRQCEHTLQGHTDYVRSLAACGDKLVSGSEDKSIRVWSTETWACERVLQEGHHTDTVCALLCARDGESLISGSYDKTMGVWRDLTRGA